MFYSLTGIREAVNDSDIIVVDCNGVGYKCFVSFQTQQAAPAAGERIKLFTYLAVREDAMDLFGFFTEEEHNCFKQLINVSGVGAKVAVTILSEFSPKMLQDCIKTGDVKGITRAKGVGPKLAQRLILELKDKQIANEATSAELLNSASFASSSSNASEAVEALVSLGYNKSQASLAVAKCDSEDSTEDMIKAALLSMSGGRL